MNSPQASAFTAWTENATELEDVMRGPRPSNEGFPSTVGSSNILISSFR